MKTVRDLIDSSFRLIGSIASGESATSAEANDALSALNDILSQWYLEGIKLEKIFQESIPLVPNIQDYTFGPDQNLDSDLPLEFKRITLNGVTDLIEMSFSDWSALPDPLLTAAVPTHFIRIDSPEFITFKMFPIPLNTGNQLVFFTRRKLTKYLSVNDNLDLPTGFSKALRYALAVELFAEYGRPPDQIVISIAADSKAEVMRSISKPTYLKSDAFGLIGKPYFNILTDGADE